MPPPIFSSSFFMPSLFLCIVSDVTILFPSPILCLLINYVLVILFIGAFALGEVGQNRNEAMRRKNVQAAEIFKKPSLY